VGTASPNIKPVESNNLLAKWLQEGCGANGIKEMMVKGNVEVEGTVKGVLQRY
jgi:tRNA ligase